MDLTVRLIPTYRRSAADTDVDVPVSVPDLPEGAMTVALVLAAPERREETYAVTSGGQMYRYWRHVPSDRVVTEPVFQTADAYRQVGALTGDAVACAGNLWRPCSPPLVRVTAERDLYPTAEPWNTPGSVTVPVWRTDWLHEFLARSEDVGELDDWRIQVIDPTVLPDLPVPDVQAVADRFRMAEEIGWIAGKPAVDLTAADLEDLGRLAGALLEEVDRDED